MKILYTVGARLLLGMALGDACGAPFEGLSFQEAGEKLKAQGIIPGRYTDDTQQALALAEIVASGEEITPVSCARSLLSAYARDPRDGYSRQTQAMLTSSEPELFLSSISNEEKRQRKTDGAAMRAAPLGFIADRRTVIQSAVTSASITHGHQDAIAATVAIALCAHERIYHFTPCVHLWDAIRGDIAEQAQEALLWWDRAAELKGLNRDVLLGTYASYGVPYTSSRIFLGAVIFLLARYGDDPCRLLIESIQLGGDTDTVAAVVLGIALVRGGDESPIWKWVEAMEDGPYGRDYLISVGNALTERFYL